MSGMWLNNNIQPQSSRRPYIVPLELEGVKLPLCEVAV